MVFEKGNTHWNKGKKNVYKKEVLDGLPVLEITINKIKI
jgi:hypothetical protein